MGWCGVLAVTALLLLLSQPARGKKGKQRDPQEEILEQLLDGYEKRLRPESGKIPLRVNATMYVVSIGPVSEVDMTFKLSLYFRQYWRDERLSFESTANGTVDKLVLSQDVVDQLWIPDSFFQTETESYVHDVTKKNIFFRLNSNGTVLMSMRVTVTSRCAMDLAHFPMDVQECVCKVASWGYTADDIQYFWDTPEPIQIADDITLSNFDLMNKTFRSYNRSLATGDWSTLEAGFVFTRNTLYFIIQMYIPSTLIVMVSWVSFWVARTAIPARAALGITTVLTLLTLISSTNANMPKISYMKAIDVYLAGCFLFVFASLIEFAVVCYMDQMIPQKIDSEKIKNQISKSKYEIQELLHSDIVLIRKPGAERSGGAECGPRFRPGDCSTLGEVEMERNYAMHNCVYPEYFENPSAFFVHNRVATIRMRIKAVLNKLMCKHVTMEDVGAIDAVSRWMFPVSFFILVLLYWIFYLSRPQIGGSPA